MTEATRPLVSACGDPEVELLIMGDTTIVSEPLRTELDTLDGNAC